MKRRNFFKIVSCSLLGLLGFPKRTKAKRTINVPFLPTLKYFQEHNEEISLFNFEYSSRGTWSAFVWRPTQKTLDKNRAQFYLVDGKWIAIDKYNRDWDDGKLGYENKIQWPNWVRKF